MLRRSRWLSRVGIFLLFTPLIFAYTGSDYLEMSVKAHQEGFYSLSNQQLEKFFEVSPEHTNADYAYLLFASNLIKLKNFEEAEKKLKSLLEKYPDSSFIKDGLKYLILVYLATENYRSSVSEYEKFRKTFGTDEKLASQITQKMYYKAVSFFNSGKIPESQEIFTILNTAFPDSKYRGRIFYYTGLTHYRTNGFIEAEQSFQKAIPGISDKEFLSDIYLKLGDCYFNMGKYDMAESFYQKVIDEFSFPEGKNWARFQLAIISKRKNEYSRAEKLLKKILDENGGDRVRELALFELGKLNIITENWESAEKYLLGLVKNYPETDIVPEALLQLGFINFNRNNLAQSIMYFEKFLSFPCEEEKKVQGYFGLGYAWFKKGEIQKASRVWGEILNDFPDSKFVPDILFLLGKKHFDGKNYPLAEKYLQKLINEFPDNSFINISRPLLIESLIMQKKLTKGKKICEDILKKYSGDEIKLAYGKILYELKNYEDAVKILKQVSSNNALMKAESLFYLATIFQKRGDISKAKEKFLEIITFYPESEELSKRAKENLEKLKDSK